MPGALLVEGQIYRKKADDTYHLSMGFRKWCSLSVRVTKYCSEAPGDDNPAAWLDRPFFGRRC